MTQRGWIPLQRTILDDTAGGRLSLHEMNVLVCLMLLADRATGMGRINAPALVYWLPELSIDAAKRTLRSLEEKRYIYREITPQRKAIYPYWVDGYEIRDGQRSRKLDLSGVFESKDSENVKFLAPEGAPETAPEGALEKSTPKPHISQEVPYQTTAVLAPEGAPHPAPEGAHNNNNNKNNSLLDKQEKSSILGKDGPFLAFNNAAPPAALPKAFQNAGFRALSLPSDNPGGSAQLPANETVSHRVSTVKTHDDQSVGGAIAPGHECEGRADAIGASAPPPIPLAPSPRFHPRFDLQRELDREAAFFAHTYECPAHPEPEDFDFDRDQTMMNETLEETYSF